RVDREQLLRRQAELLGAGGQEVLQHHVALAHQLVQHLPARRLRHVQGDAALVAVARQVVGAGAVIAQEGRPPGTRRVAPAGALRCRLWGPGPGRSPWMPRARGPPSSGPKTGPASTRDASSTRTPDSSGGKGLLDVTDVPHLLLRAPPCYCSQCGARDPPSE